MKKLQYIFVVVLVLLCASCARKDKNGILSERAMVDVLYDYQLAIAMADEDASEGNAAEKEYLYTKAVFKKYDMTQAEFDLSVAHYARDPKTMLSIIKKVSERYTGTIKKDQDALAEERAMNTTTSDTVQVWRSNADIVLTANGNNRFHTTLPGKLIGKGDRLVLGFNTSWIYREGSKMGFAIIRVTYENDSTSVTAESIREFSDKQAFGLSLDSKRKVKSVDIDIYQNAKWRKHPQILYISALRLFRMTSKKNKEADKTPPPSPVAEEETKITEPLSETPLESE